MRHSCRRRITINYKTYVLTFPQLNMKAERQEKQSIIASLKEDQVGVDLIGLVIFALFTCTVSVCHSPLLTGAA